MLKRHKRYLDGHLGGVRDDLSNQNLSGMRLSDLGLRRAILTGTNLGSATTTDAIGIDNTAS